MYTVGLAQGSPDTLAPASCGYLSDGVLLNFEYRLIHHIRASKLKVVVFALMNYMKFRSRQIKLRVDLIVQLLIRVNNVKYLDNALMSGSNYNEWYKF